MKGKKPEKKEKDITKNKIAAVFIILTFLAAGAQSSFASGIDKLMKYASPGGSMSNVNKAAIIKDQQGGYMTGGSVILRGPRPKSLQPLVVQTPKFAYDACTGSADFRFGGLSYISNKEFTSFFKNTATASGAYAVKMLVKASCPQCEDVMSSLESVARDINGLAMEQCSAGRAIAGGLFNAASSANRQRCLMKGNITKSGKDMYDAGEKCAQNPDRYGDTGDENELESMLGDEFNLVWKALGKSEKDTAFKELIMSVSGTVIGRKADGSFRFTAKPSLAVSGDLLESYMGLRNKAGSVKLYKCDNPDKCLNPTETDVTLEAGDTLYGNISRILEKMVPKILEGRGELTDEEEALAAFSSIPIIRIIEAEVVRKARPEDTIVRMEEFIELLCYDLVSNFLAQAAEKAASAVASLEYAQVDGTIIENFAERAAEVRRFITDSKFAAFKRLQAVTRYKERLTLEERSFKEEFSRFLEHSGRE